VPSKYYFGRVLGILGADLIVAKGSSIHIADPDRGSSKPLVFLPVNFLIRLLMRLDFFSRLFRLEISHIEFSCDHIYVFANKKIFIFDRCNQRFFESIDIKFRPIVIAQNSTAIFFGEYKNNKTRDPVAFYKLEGTVLNKIHELVGIRHIHGVQVDSFTGKLVVTTGDSDSESGILLFDGDWETLVEGSQLSRAVSVVFEKDFYAYATDTPLKQNYWCKVCRDTKVTVKKVAIPSSVFYSVSANDSTHFFSTVVEPSRVNTTRYVRVYMVKDDMLVLVLKVKKDPLPCWLFQHGQVTQVIDERRRGVWVSFKATKHSGRYQFVEWPGS